MRAKTILAGVALGGLAVVAALPATGWLVRQQLRSVFGAGAARSLYDGAERRERVGRLVAQAPGDFKLAFGEALEHPTARPDTPSAGPQALLQDESLELLNRRFPGHPEALAVRLRLATRGPVRVNRLEEELALEDKKPDPKRAITAVDPMELARFEATAAEGERVDPDNAYFPAMRAIGLYGAHRDDEAKAALHRAAQKRIWREYVPEEVAARTGLGQAVYGRTGAVPEMAISAAILFPHYAQLRAMSRVVTAQAVRAEASGDMAGGYALRSDLLALSRRMRDDSTTVIGSLVGIAINAIARLRPGGVPYLPGVSTNLSEDDSWNRTRERFTRFADWTGTLGHPEEVRLAEADWATARIIKRITRQGSETGLWSLKPLVRLGAVEGAGTLALANALWMLLLGGLAALLVRKTALRTGGKLPAAPFFVGSLACWAVLCAAAAIATSGALDPVRMVVGLTSENGSIPAGQALLAGACCLAVPLLTWIVLILRAAFTRRASFSRTVVLGVHRAALPIACILLLGYCGLTLWSAGLETDVRGEMAESLRHEGRYMARITGNVWPADEAVAR